MKGQLTVVNRDGGTRNYPLEQDRIHIGRSHKSDLRIEDPMISRKHFVIERYGEQYILINLNTKNLGDINGVIMAVDRSYPLKIGDEITIGKTKIKFNAVPEATPAGGKPPAIVKSEAGTIPPTSGTGGLDSTGSGNKPGRIGKSRRDTAGYSPAAFVPPHPRNMAHNNHRFSYRQLSGINRITALS